jgi:hypothetical protein
VYAILLGDQPNRCLEPDVGSEFEATGTEVDTETDVPTAEDDDDPEEALTSASEAEELFESIKDTIASLFRIAVVIRNASPRDRFLKASSGQTPFEESFDVQHVGHKYPKLEAEGKQWLKQRLGKAITQRRQFLWYAREHRRKLGREPPEIWLPTENAANIASATLPIRPNWTGASQGAQTHISKPVSTLAPTAASTLLLPDAPIVETDFRDDYSHTSYALSVGEDGDENQLQLPRLSDVSKNLPSFECPFCWQIQSFRKESAWRKHALSDLRPYVCTHGDCDVKLFADRQHWFDHELKEHRVRWHCPFCSILDFTSYESFRGHILRQHAESVAHD